VKGPHITPGYVDPAQNAQSFVDGWFITGDLGRIDPDGRTYLTGRAKDVIIRGGHNIDPLMIEQTLLQHPDVQLCAAVGQPDSYSGEIPVAFVQLAPGSTISLDNLLNEIRPSFPEPAAIPKRLYRVDSFPVTSTGKILKPALRQKTAETVVTEKLNSIVPPGTPLQISFQQSGHQETRHLRLPANTEPDILGKVREAVTSLRIPFNVSLA
jgi:fatty-acyl-CoA synthase